MSGAAKALYDRKSESGLQVAEESALHEALSAVREDPEAWFTLCYLTKSKVKVQSTGSGLESLANLLLEKSDKVYYAMKGAFDIDGKPRMLAITWAGAHASAMKKGRISMHGGAIEAILTGAIARVNIAPATEDAAEFLTEAALLELVTSSSSSGVALKSIP